MAKAKLFQYAAIWYPKDNKENKGEKAKLVLELKTILAESDKEVLLKAARELPDEYLDQLEQIDIVIIPF